MCDAHNHSASCCCGFGDGWNASSGSTKSLNIQYDKYINSICYRTSCPVCGDSVFYCEPSQGGRVFFDPPLGRPWSLHPCTTSKTCNTPFSINYPIELDIQSDGTVKSVSLYTGEGVLILYFEDNCVIRHDFYEDIKSNRSVNTLCLVIKEEGNRYYNIVLKKSEKEKKVRVRDVQEFVVYGTDKIPKIIKAK